MIRLGARAFTCMYVQVGTVDLEPGIDCHADQEGVIQLATLIANPTKRLCDTETVNGINT